MSKPMLLLAKTASALTASRKEAGELKARVARLEKRAEAEAFLLKMADDPRAPLFLKPSSVADFMAKRAAIEEQDLEVAKLAARLYGGQDFGIGDPEQPTSAAPYDESRADAEFTDWLAGF
jgi:hypothetical protein